MREIPKKVYAILLLAMIFWSLSFLWVKAAYDYISPISTTFLRLVISIAVLYSLSFFFKWLKPIEKKDYKYIFLLALFEPFLYFLGESFGLLYVSSTIAAVMVATIPLFTPLVAFYFLRERITVLNVLGLVVSFTGVGLMVLDNNLDFKVSPKGLGFMMLAVVAATGSSILLKKMSGKYNPVSIITFQNTIGVILFMPLFLVFDLKNFIAAEKPPVLWANLVALAVFCSSLAFILLTYCLRFIGISKANVFANIIPVFTAIFAYFWLDEEISSEKVIGILVVISGLFLSQVNRGVHSWLGYIRKLHRKG